MSRVNVSGGLASKQSIGLVDASGNPLSSTNPLSSRLFDGSGNAVAVDRNRLQTAQAAATTSVVLHTGTETTTNLRFGMIDTSLYKWLILMTQITAIVGGTAVIVTDVSDDGGATWPYSGQTTHVNGGGVGGFTTYIGPGGDATKFAGAFMGFRLTGGSTYSSITFKSTAFLFA